MASFWRAFLIACLATVASGHGVGEYAHDGHEHAHEHEHDSVVEVDADSYRATVVDSEFAWLVELSSKHCGSCKEFAPQWEALTRAYSGLHFAHVSIDTPSGRELAKELGALKEGIPNVKLVHTSAAAPTLIHSGEDAARVSARLDRALAALAKDEAGFYLKAGVKTEL
jgi:thiol-disulfide isomerase/thioredoxin